MLFAAEVKLAALFNRIDEVAPVAVVTVKTPAKINVTSLPDHPPTSVAMVVTPETLNVSPFMGRDILVALATVATMQFAPQAAVPAAPVANCIAPSITLEVETVGLRLVVIVSKRVPAPMSIFEVALVQLIPFGTLRMTEPPVTIKSPPSTKIP